MSRRLCRTDLDEQKHESNRDKARRTAKKEARLRSRPKAKAKGPTQADCVAHGLGLAFMSGMFKKNGW